jgi:AraC family transcriptional regulator
MVREEQAPPLDDLSQSRIMSQPSTSRQLKHRPASTTGAAANDAVAFRPGIAMVPRAPGSDHAAIMRKDERQAKDATTVAFERLGLVIAIEADLRRDCGALPYDRALDIGCLRVEVPRECRSATASNHAPKLFGRHEDDPVVRRLSAALSMVEGLQPAYGAICADALRFAAVARLFALQPDTLSQFGDRARADQCVGDRRIHGLQRWRLKRVLDHIQGHFGDKMPLSDLAAVAGLSRMHFAAQFRVATGLRPHEYIVRYRIQRAKDLLLSRGMPIVEIAMAVGFQSQAHFTTTFRRFVGHTPSRWRDAVAADIDP